MMQWRVRRAKTSAGLAGVLCLFCLPQFAGAQEPAKAQPSPAALHAMLCDASHYQLVELARKDVYLRYVVDERTDRGERVRDLIETTEGPVSRLISQDGHSLTPQEEQAERKRLQSLTPSDMEKKRRSEESTRKFAAELISAIPQAFLATETPGQPQLPGVAPQQVVLDLKPNPSFRPASTVQTLLTGLTARMWLDATDHHLIRTEVRVQKNLNLAWGLVARVFPGGTLTYQQREIGGGHVLYTAMSTDLELRELMIHTRPYRNQLRSSDAQVLPKALTLKEGVQALLQKKAPESSEASMAAACAKSAR